MILVPSSLIPSRSLSSESVVTSRNSELLMIDLVEAYSESMSVFPSSLLTLLSTTLTKSDALLSSYL